MNTRKFILAGLGLVLLAGNAFPQAKKQVLREMKVSAVKPARVVPPRDSTVLIVKSSIRNLRLESTLGERIKDVGGGVWQMYLSPEPQKIFFTADGYKKVEQNYTFAKNIGYQVEISPKKGGKTLLWVALGAGAAGGAYFAFNGGGNGPTPPPTAEKLPDPPGSPTGN